MKVKIMVRIMVVYDIKNNRKYPLVRRNIHLITLFTVYKNPPQHCLNTIMKSSKKSYCYNSLLQL